MFYITEPTQALHRAGELVQALNSAVESCPPKGLDAFHDIFRQEPATDHLEDIKAVLLNTYKLPKLTQPLLDVYRGLENFVLFVKQIYLPCKNIFQSTKTLYSLLIKKEEAMADLLISLKNSQSFPKSGLVVFIVLTDFYLLLLQELMLIDSSKESQWLPQIKLTSKMCVRHLLTLYTTLWKVRLEGISNVHNYTCGNNQNSDFQCVATVLDIYNRRSSSIILSTILCQLADDDAIHKTFQLYVSILHEKYIADVFTYFDKTLQFPIGSCQTWMKICLPSSSRMASCRVLNSMRHLAALPASERPLKQYDPTKLRSGKYSQLSDLVPVFTVIELEPVESSESVVLPYLENLEEDEYAYARCEVKVDKEGSNSVTLFELACVPESMKTELLKRNKQIEEKELIDKIVIRILNARCAKQ
ncbi:hypothetical protein EB796_015784 [Bugula neritina]|uniref:Uncharacterized protein n=1 Tax=Bugula neritina TaxID=10212 RepID=A0A7J7JJW3_BUGNE|nr:hypothetical protein EB796_015784 [Bugula neritina]